MCEPCNRLGLENLQASSNSWEHGCVFLSRVGAGRSYWILAPELGVFINWRRNFWASLSWRHFSSGSPTWAHTGDSFLSDSDLRVTAKHKGRSELTAHNLQYKKFKANKVWIFRGRAEAVLFCLVWWRGRSSDVWQERQRLLKRAAADYTLLHDTPTLLHDTPIFQYDNLFINPNLHSLWCHFECVSSSRRVL